MVCKVGKEEVAGLTSRSKAQSFHVVHFQFHNFMNHCIFPNGPHPPENQEKRKQDQVGQKRSKRKRTQRIPDMCMTDKILESGEQSKSGERQKGLEAGDRRILLQIMGQTL